MKKLPIGIQTFSEIIEGDLLYIDKTKDIYRLINSGKYYFLSRPRRFGKSLTLSTIKEIYSGNKHFFKGLWIENNWNWEKRHTTIHISFGSIGYKTLGLVNALEIMLDKLASENTITLDATTYDQKFKELIQKLSFTKNKVVILIDEYDKPLIDYMDDLGKAKMHQQILKTFYAILKDSDPYIELLFITGVSKFSKVSVFSDLNNLEDITMGRQFSTLTGYTQEELEIYFESYILELQEEYGGKIQLLKSLKSWYNGYSWDGKKYVYNPFSVLRFFKSQEFSNFWFTTGTPGFLIKLLHERMIYNLENIQVGDSVFESYNLDNLETISLLFQTGYLTIKQKGEIGTYTLDYPNKEVKNSMLQHLIGAFSHGSGIKSTPIVVELRDAFIHKNPTKIISIINGVLKTIPSHIFIAKKEAYYHSVVHLLLTYLGQYIESEVHTSDGRMDAVIKTVKYIYILEFKLDKTADDALQQIEQKQYASRFTNDGRKIITMGINFSSSTKSVDDWKIN